MLAIKKSIPLFLVGLLSGYVSVLLTQNTETENIFMLMLIPGFIFGLVIGFYFYVSKRVKFFPNGLFFSLISFCSYLTGFVAFALMTLFLLALFGKTADDSFDLFNQLLIFFIPGMVQTYILCKGIHNYLTPLTAKQFQIFVIVGGLLAFFASSLNNGEDGTDIVHMYEIFIITWQGAMAGLLGWILTTKKKKNHK